MPRDCEGERHCRKTEIEVQRDAREHFAELKRAGCDVKAPGGAGSSANVPVAVWWRESLVAPALKLSHAQMGALLLQDPEIAEFREIE